MKLKLALLAALCLTTFHLQSDPSEEPSAELIIYNRILAKVNGKTVSVIDVMKRMDFFLQKHYPQFANSKMARHQFYSTQWKEYLSQIIDTELMLADAEKLEVKVSDADVREEILKRFGTSIMSTLDQMGVSYEECKQMIHDELVVQQMQWFRVNSKALSKVNSQDVKKAYKQYCEEHPELEEWQYQVLSIRSPNKTASELLAAKAFDLLKQKLDMAALSDALKAPDEATTITISPEMRADEKSISSSHKDVLKTLSENTFSSPIAQLSRVDNSVVYRIFHLKKHSKTTVPPFEKMAENLKDQLLQDLAQKENAGYIVRLRERLGYDEKHMTETLPSDFQPFALR